MRRKPIGKRFHYVLGDTIEAKATTGIVGHPSIRPQSTVKNSSVSDLLLTRYMLDLDVSIWITKTIEDPLRDRSSYTGKDDGLCGRKVMLLLAGNLVPKRRTTKSGAHTGTPFDTKGYTYAEIRKQLPTVPN